MVAWGFYPSVFAARAQIRQVGKKSADFRVFSPQRLDMESITRYHTRRRFGPIAHGTKKPKRLYNGRTAAERVNSPLKQGQAAV